MKISHASDHSTPHYPSSMPLVNSYAAYDKQGQLVPCSIPRRPLGPQDIKIAIEYCGVCHSDIHYARGDFGEVPYPVVPGHEILGRVVETGPEVTKFNRGDVAAVGVLTDNCGRCENCTEGEENYCPKKTSTYGSPDKTTGTFTFGGYSESIVVKEPWVFRVPESLYTAAAAPLLCAGITTFAPLHRAQIKPGQRVAVVGLGGLGHLGIKIAKAMGAHVLMVTTSAAKGQDAKLLGADEVLLSTDKAQLKKFRGTIDFVLNTIPVDHDVDTYVKLLRKGGHMSIVGRIGNLTVNTMFLLANRVEISGSSIGSISETQEMLNFCAKHEILADVETIKINQLNQANDRVLRNDIKYRFVVDMSSLPPLSKA